METISDIVREMRGYADKQERMSIYDLRDLATETLRVFADRIEAAYKRELVPNRNKLGNNAKMREILLSIRGIVNLYNYKFIKTHVPRLCDEALAEAEGGAE